METRLRTGDRERVVQLTSDGERLRASLDGAVHELVCTRVGSPTSAHGATVEELALDIDGRRLCVTLARRRDRVLVAIAGHVYTFDVGEEGRGAERGGGGTGRVVAPMPGKIVAVLVEQGEAVEAGQAVAILEAMKMETTLLVEVRGTVARLDVVAGAMVDAGQIVIEVEPAA